MAFEVAPRCQPGGGIGNFLSRQFEEDRHVIRAALQAIRQRLQEGGRYGAAGAHAEILGTRMADPVWRSFISTWPAMSSSVTPAGPGSILNPNRSILAMASMISRL